MIKSNLVQNKGLWTNNTNSKVKVTYYLKRAILDMRKPTKLLTKSKLMCPCSTLLFERMEMIYVYSGYIYKYNKRIVTSALRGYW